MKYTLQGRPIPLARPKFSTLRAYHAYDPQKDLKEESRFSLRMQHGYSKLLNGPLTLDITFFMEIPKSSSKKKKKALLNKPHIIKPDLSNLIKYVEDVCQGIIFRDDSEITIINARKQYSDWPHTEFTIIEENNETNQKE